MSNSLRPHGLYTARLLCPQDFPGKNTGVGKPFPSPGDLPDPGIEPRSPTWQADSLPSKPPGKPQNMPRPDSNATNVSSDPARMTSPFPGLSNSCWLCLTFCLSLCIFQTFPIKESQCLLSTYYMPGFGSGPSLASTTYL